MKIQLMKLHRDNPIVSSVLSKMTAICFQENLHQPSILQRLPAFNVEPKDP
jgi:hypothetical protein